MKKHISILSAFGVLLAITAAAGNEFLAGTLGYASKADVEMAGGTQQQNCRPIDFCQGNREACEVTFTDDLGQQVSVILRDASCVTELKRN